MEHRELVVFVKEPRPGLVKTRLGRTLGLERAAEIYRLCADEVIRLAKTVEHETTRVTVCYDPDSRAEEVRRWVNAPSIRVIRQQGTSLGDRMRSAFAQAMEGGAERVLLVGSDIPELDRKILDEGWAALDRHDIVLGPSSDGGYYLIGMKPPLKDLFADIQWSAPTVYEATRGAAALQGFSVWALPVLADIDREEDFLAYQQRLRERLSRTVHDHR